MVKELAFGIFGLCGVKYAGINHMAKDKWHDKQGVNINYSQEILHRKCQKYVQ